MSTEEIDFHLIKSTLFRNISFDGAFGALSPHGKVHVTLFTERATIPKKVVFKLEEGDVIGDEVVDKREGKEGITRDLEANLVFDFETAQMLKELLEALLEDDSDEERRRSK